MARHQESNRVRLLGGAAWGCLAYFAAIPAYAQSDSEIIVTAQKKEERIIDVPIAMTALSAEALDDYKIEGGSELLRAIPNVNFSKSNFSMYNFSIRGVGTKAISASSDPAVAVSFNNTALVRNRLFESEFFDMQRVEVLRGPQGTLYGRNATAGVVNLIPALPTDVFEGSVTGEIGNFDSRRLKGMLNIPLADGLALRASGAMTKRDGFDYNNFTKRRVNGRDLWSARAILDWQASDSFRANVIWQRFHEDDDRSRTGKQLCTRDPGPETVGGVVVPDAYRGRLSQGCSASSLYADAAYGTPNARGFAYIVAGHTVVTMGYDPNTYDLTYGIIDADPFEGVVQSRNLREIETAFDPVFRAKNDVVQFNVDADVADGVKFVSQTAYARDRYYSSQDFNRYISKPIFYDTDGLIGYDFFSPFNQFYATPGGIFTDPQLGASSGILALDINRSRNRQWSQEFRLQSDFSGPVNFNLGVNYLDFKTQDDYFVFNNVFTFLAYNLQRPNIADYYPDLSGADRPICPEGDDLVDCVYIDPNPLGSLNERGHNYFLSRNIARTKSWSVFGELYWNAADNVKVTLGARLTRDKKIFTPVPSQLLLGGGYEYGSSGGYVNSGYPADPEFTQRWTKPTGRLVVDWTPDTGFSDKTLVYASLSRGYKGGGANPPRPAINPRIVQFEPLPGTFKPEYVNAFELGTKNSFGGGKFTLNATAFYYDYKDYQVSQIVDRISFNENFDAETWGLEFEAAWRPTPALRLDGNLGYLRTRLKKGAQSIDVMNRTQGNEDWVLLRPWIQVPSNCIAPKEYVAAILARADTYAGLTIPALSVLCNGSRGLGSFTPDFPGFNMSRIYGFTYNPLTDAPNGGRGFFPDLEGNELPNAPRMTLNLGAQYSFDLGRDWGLTVRGDYYTQTKSFARVYNTEYDRLRGWSNSNAQVTLDNKAHDFSFQFYVKNIFNKTPLTDAYTNSDDGGLTTNIFSLEPRIYGINATKKF